MKKLQFPQKYPVTCHTDHVGPGSTFVAIKGYEKDGTTFINKAIKKGAIKIVLSNNIKNIKTKKDINYIFVKNPRKELARLASIALGNPAAKLKIIGVTGTKGKTTTTYLIDHILQQAGFKTALLGTIKNKIDNQEIQSFMTTPPSDYIQVFLDQCVKQKVDFVIMEVSSHALSLDRMYNIKFDAIGFTNLSPEHMDFYKNMQQYFAAKYKIFNQVKSNGSIIINHDDEWGIKAITKLKQNIVTFSQNKNNSTFNLKITQNNLKGINFILNKNIEIYCPNLFGQFNAYNIAMAFLICKQLSIPTTKLQQAIKTFNGVPGRLQKHVLKNKALAFVDFAHNPSSFDSTLKTLKELNPNLIVVFGCGGNRDKTKRPIMGKLACKYSNQIIITDDNPRNENRKKIIQEILVGIDTNNRKNIFCVPDRDKAIKKAVELSNKDSVIAILGKGHENYYYIKNKILYFDDFEQISKY